METPPSELMALSATDDPRLMSERRELTNSETKTARRGML
jgi:hypothetical protein